MTRCTHRIELRLTNNSAPPRRPDGTLDVAAWCRTLDTRANVGAGPTREDRR